MTAAVASIMNIVVASIDLDFSSGQCGETRSSPSSAPPDAGESALSGISRYPGCPWQVSAAWTRISNAEEGVAASPHSSPGADRALGICPTSGTDLMAAGLWPSGLLQAHVQRPASPAAVSALLDEL